MCEKWRKEAKATATSNLSKSEARLVDLEKQVEQAKADIEKYKKQVDCNHEMVEGDNGSMFGGMDSDICTHCGYKYYY